MGNPQCIKCDGFQVGEYVKTENRLLYFKCPIHGEYTTSAGPTEEMWDMAQFLLQNSETKWQYKIISVRET